MTLALPHTYGAALRSDAVTVDRMALHLVKAGPAAIATEADAIRALFGHFPYRDITFLAEDARLAAFRIMVAPSVGRNQ